MGRKKLLWRGIPAIYFMLLPDFEHNDRNCCNFFAKRVFPVEICRVIGYNVRKGQSQVCKEAYVGLVRTDASSRI